MGSGRKPCVFAPPNSVANHSAAMLQTHETATSLFAANSGALDDIEAKKVVAFEAALLAYMNTSQTALMDEINESGDYNDDIAAKLQAAIDDFKANNTW